MKFPIGRHNMKSGTAHHSLTACRAVAAFLYADISIRAAKTRRGTRTQTGRMFGSEAIIATAEHTGAIHLMKDAKPSERNGLLGNHREVKS